MSSACSFIFIQIKVIFIRMVSHLDSLWNRGTRELGNGLLLCFGFATLKLTLFSFAQTMRTELLTKQNDFLPVAQHGALLFSVMCELQKLHPYYRFPLDGFMQLFHDTVAERNRGKKSSGSPAARAAELVTALSRKIFERTSWSLFQSK